MQSLFPHETFTGLGPSRIHPTGFTPIHSEARGRQMATLRTAVRMAAPKLPGVYGMIDRRGRLIYIGKAKMLRARLLSYFRENSRDPKAGRILERVDTIVWETATDEFAALIRELELIRRFRPRFNVQGQPGNRRYIYLCLGRAPAPYAFATRDPTGKELAMYGPLVGAARVRESARRLNDAFLLRDCTQRQTMRFAEDRNLFKLEFSPGCLRHEIGTCAGPCAGFCTRDTYSEKIQAARRFLEGHDRTLLATLENEMREASARLEFERAMVLRDKLADLRGLTDRLVWLKNARDNHSFVYPLIGADERTVWYLIERGQVRAAVYPPKNKRTRRIVGELIQSVYAERRPATVMPHGQVDSVLLVAAWFRKQPAERTKCLSADEALQAINEPRPS